MPPTLGEFKTTEIAIAMPGSYHSQPILKFGKPCIKPLIGRV